MELLIALNTIVYITGCLSLFFLILGFIIYVIIKVKGVFLNKKIKDLEKNFIPKTFIHMIHNEFHDENKVICMLCDYIIEHKENIKDFKEKIRGLNEKN